MKGNTLLILRDREEVVRIFNPAQIEPLEIDYEGNGERTQRFDYTITNPNTCRTEVFHASTRNSGDIDALENDTSVTVTGPYVSILEILEF